MKVLQYYKVRNKISYSLSIILIISVIASFSLQTSIVASENRLITGTISLPNGDVAPIGGIGLYIGAITIGTEEQYSTNTYVMIPEGTNSVTYSLQVIDKPTGGYAVDYWFDTYQKHDRGYVEQGYYTPSGTIWNGHFCIPISVNGSDVSNINLTILQGVKISGTLSLPSGMVAPKGGINVNVSIVNDNGTPGNDQDNYSRGSFNTIIEGSSSINYSIAIPSDMPGESSVFYGIDRVLGLKVNGYYNINGTVPDISSITPIVVGSDDITNINFVLLKEIPDDNYGLVAYYPFDGNALDASNNGNDGTAYGGVQYENGVVGMAAKFNGSDGYISVNDSSSLDPGNSMTISAWIQFDPVLGPDQYSHIISKWGGVGNASYALAYNIGSNTISFGFHNADLCNYNINSSQLEIGRWYYITAIGTPNNIKLYVDGQMQSSLDVDYKPIDGNNPLIIGRENTVSRWFFKGMLDEVRIYNRALSDNEILELYHNVPSVENIEVTAYPDKTEYTVGESIDLSGLEVKATYSDGRVSTIPQRELSISGFNSSLPVNDQIVTITFAGASTTINVSIMKTILAAHFEFNQNTNDSSGNGNNGTASGNVQFTNGGAISFDGVDDYVSVEDNASLQLKKALTIGTWVNFNELDHWTYGYEWQAIMTKPGYTDSYGLMLSSHTYGPGIPDDKRVNILRFYHNGLTTSCTDYNWYSLQPNTWYHICVTYDGNAAKIYIDGSLVASESVSGDISQNSCPLYIGYCASPSLPYPLDGYMDDIRIYNGALSEDEISEIVTASSIIDNTPPVITLGDYLTTPTNQDITVTATSNEGTINEESHTFTENGSFDFVATDEAGNTTIMTVTISNIDKEAPAISMSAPVDGATYTLFQKVLANWSTTDNLSGIASTNGTVASGAAIDTGSVGIKIIKVTATDKAGNVSSKTLSYKVIYGFAGFFQPVDSYPTVNIVKAGSAIPTKFSLHGNQGLSIFADGYPTSAKVTEFADTLPSDAIEITISTAGNSNLSYDAATDQYTYVWKTEKTWSGTCRQLIVKLKDGTVHILNFKFK